jgi:hypothetical protein
MCIGIEKNGEETKKRIKSVIVRSGRIQEEHAVFLGVREMGR